MLLEKIQLALQNAKKRSEGEGGFTLIELLVVILIIGILAAIALPTFLGQSDKAKDSGAKSDARNAVSQVESCFATDQAYTNCTTDAQLGSKTGLKFGAVDAPGTVNITAGADTYTITATSKAKSGGTAPSAYQHYVIARAADGAKTYTCTATGKGGCPGNGNWLDPAAASDDD